MNTRNVHDLVTQKLLASYENASDTSEEDSISDKLFYGRKIYVRKMERLYYKIRLFKLREWWE